MAKSMTCGLSMWYSKITKHEYGVIYSASIIEPGKLAVGGWNWLKSVDIMLE